MLENNFKNNFYEFSPPSTIFREKNIFYERKKFGNNNFDKFENQKILL